MPSLEELIKQFAELARRQLMEEVERQKNKDTSTAKWEGYDADGNPIVKDGDQTKTVKGLGNTGMVKGTKLILDDVGSVEYKRRTKQEDKKVTRKKRRVAEPTRLVVRDNLISVAAAVEEEIYYLTEEELPVFEIPDDGFYVCTYSTVRSAFTNVEPFDVETSITAGLADYSVSQTENVPSYTNQATGGTTWRISAGAIAVASRRAGGQDGTASANLSGLGINLSGSCSGSQLIGDAAIDISETTAGGDFEYELDGSNLALLINLLGGNAAADAECMHITFPRAIWYYQILNDPEDETLTRIREIDLNNLVPNQVFESKLVHNFTAREGDNAFVYSIWYVIDVDMTQTETTVDTNNGDEREIRMFIGRKTRYIVHARLNIATGEIEAKVNESPNTGDYRGAPFNDIIEYPNDEGFDGQWLAEARALGDASGGVGSSIGVIAFVGSSTASIEDDLATSFFNPEAVWRESYDGDWINAYSDVIWSNAAFVNVTDNELADFLLSSYKQGNFYRGWDSLMSTDLATPEFIEWDPTGNSFEGNARPDGDWRDIENLQAAIEINGTSIQYANYFDGSQANTPDDFTQWRTWTGVDLDGVEEERLGPNFATPDNVNETGVPRGDRLRDHVWFSFVPPSA